MFVDPLQARQERERQERERLARIQAEKKRLEKIKAENERQAKLKEEKKRLAKLREEKDRQAKLKEEKKHSDKKPQEAKHPDQKPTEVKKTDTKKPDLKAETKKSTDQKPENKKPQSENKLDDKASTDITWSKPGEISPVYSSASSLYSRPPIGQGSEAKPKVPLGRNARPWNGEKTEEPEPKPETKPYQPRDLKAVRARVEERARQRELKKEETQNTLKQFPGIQNIVNQPSFFNGAMSLGAGLVNPFLGVSLQAGAQIVDRHEKSKHTDKPESWLSSATHFGEDLNKGATNLGHQAQQFTEAIPGWIDKHVDSLLKRRSEIISTQAKQLEHIPVVGKAAQAFAWFDNKMGEFSGGILKGAGSLVGGVANMVTHPVETVSGIYSMAEHVPLMGGLIPNPLKLAHAGADILFSGADPKQRLEVVLNPQKSLADDAKFGQALVDGFIEPYKKSWSEGKYFEVAGRATFDIGSMFIGAGEANAAIKTTEVAGIVGKTAEVTNVVGKTSKVANVAGKTDKVAEVASITDKVADTGKGAKTTTEAIERANKAADGAKASKNVDFAEGSWDGKRRAGVGNLEGRRLSRRELNSLEHELNENGLNLNRKADKVIRQQGGTEKARAAFDYESGTVLLRNGATHFEAFHEMTHARQFIEIGQEAYVNLGRFEREAHVFNTVWKNRKLFNKSEVEASIEYIRYLRTMKRLGRID
jgi:hypothetical protein